MQRLGNIGLKSIAYWNGTWVPVAELSIPLDDLGFSMGTTIVERLRTFGGKLFRTKQHLERLGHSLTIMGWDAKALCQEIEAALAVFVQRNETLLLAGDDWTVTVFITPGSLARAAKPTVCVHGSPLPFQNWAKRYETGLEAVIVKTRQVPENCWPSALKCRSRLHYFLADQEAASRQPGTRAILLDQEGFVGEGTTANVVAYFADRGLVTPLRSKVLPGVTQEVLFELADSLEIAHCEADLLPEELAKADELYFTSTSICLLPVVRLNENDVGNGQPGSTFHRFMAAWSELVGVEIVRQATRFGARRETASE